MKYKIAQAVSVIFVIIGSLLALHQVNSFIFGKELSYPFSFIALGLIIGGSITCSKARESKYLHIIKNQDGEEIIYLLKVRYDYLEKKGLLDEAKLSFTNYCEQVITNCKYHDTLNPLHLAALISLAGDPGIVLLRKALLRFDTSLLAYVFARARIDKRVGKQIDDIASPFIMDTVQFNNVCNARNVKNLFCDAVIECLKAMKDTALDNLAASAIQEEINLFETRTKLQILNYKIKKQQHSGKSER